MDFILLLLFLYIALCCKPCRNGDLSSGAMLPIRGLCALGIIFHHVTQNIPCDSTLLFKYFDFTGPIFVAVFFAFSGFALSAQYDRKGREYLQCFLKNRLGALLLPYLLYVFLYFLARLLLNQLTGDPSPIYSTSGTVLYSWYVKAILFLYILYYVAQQASCGKSWRFRLLLGAGLIGYVLFCRLSNYGIWWYNSIWAFPFGMLYYKLYRSGKPETPWMPIVLSFAVFGISLVLRLKLFTFGIPGLAMDCLMSLSFPLLLFSFLQRFSIRSQVLDYLGSRSYEIYLAQGIPILFLRSKLFPVASPLLFCGITILSALLIAECVYQADQKLLSLFRSRTSASVTE